MNRLNVRLLLIVCPLSFVLTGCIGYAIAFSASDPPPAPDSRWSIAWTCRNHTHLNLSALKPKDFPALKKFQELKEAQFGPHSNSATDEKMEALGVWASRTSTASP